jgi:drug/metabolite transporter (DMT)-like permease
MGFPGWMVGVGLSLLGSVSTNIGMLLQKLDFIIHAKRVEREIGEAKYDEAEGAFYGGGDASLVESSHWQWKLGFTLFILGQVLNGVALSFAAQSMLATLGAFSLVSNTLFAPCLLQEELSWMHIVSMILIIAGAIIVVLNSSHAEHNFTAEQLEKLYYRPAFIILMCFVIFAVSSVLLYRWYLKKFERNKILPGPLYAFLAAVFGSLSVLFSKSTAQLIKQTCQGDNQLDEPLTWIVICLTIVCGATSVRALNEGLQSNTKALFLIPLYFVLALVGQVSGGASYFGDFDHMKWDQCITVLGGVGLTIVGVFISSMHDSKSDEVVKLEKMGVDLNNANNHTSSSNNINTSDNSDGNYNLNKLKKTVSLPPYELSHVPANSKLTRRNSGDGTGSTRSLIRRASILKFSLHPEAYSESFQNQKLKGDEGSRLLLETICDDNESINSYGSVTAVTKEMEVTNGTSNRRNSNIRRNDNYFMSTNTYGTDVPGSYRLDNFRPKNVSPKQRKKKSKRRYSVSVLGGFGVA